MFSISFIIGIIIGFVIYFVFIKKSEINNQKQEEEIIKSEKENNDFHKDNEINKEQPSEIEKEEPVEIKEKQSDNFVYPEEFKSLLLDELEMKKEIENNIQNAMDEYGMDYETIASMFKDLKEQLEQQKENIYKFYENKKWEELEQEFHSLKGAALNLKFNLIGIPIKYLDDCLKDNNYIKELNENNNKYKDFKKLIDIIYEKKDLIFKFI